MFSSRVALPLMQRRRAMRLAYWNGALAAIGSGLASGPLVLYLVMEHDVTGLGVGIGVILAAPHLLGLLRLAVPVLIDRLGGRKAFCTAAYALSGLMLAGLPLATAPGRFASARSALAATVMLWCAGQLFEYLGLVALWSWLADLAPQRVRGRFIGRRERWMAIGQAAAMLASGLCVRGWLQRNPGSSPWPAYATIIVLGAVFILSAAAVLAFMPSGRRVEPVQRRLGLSRLARPWADGRFVRLLAVGCWISLCNGLMQSPQNIFPNRILGMSLFTMLALKVGLRLGQWPVSPRLGRLTDRWGNRPVIAASLLLVAQGPMFYCLATPDRPWWIIGAWTCWIAWAGLNIGLPNLLLKLSPPASNTPHIAAYFAVTGLCHGISTIAGGQLLDRFHDASWTVLGLRLDYYHAAFLCGWLAGSAGVVLLLAVVQEPAKRTD